MRTIYINTRQSEEHRIVIAQSGKLTGFEQDIVGWENKKGDIYKGVVTRIEEGLDAAFVNFGESKNGFLPLKHIAADLPGASGGQYRVAEGDSILVQIKKDHVGDKGAGLTTNISLAGCYLVLMPQTKKDKTMVSKNISGQDRRKITESLDGLNIPDGMSVIVRTAGIGRPQEDLRWDLESYLLKLWRAVETAAQNNRGPVLIYRENNLLLRAVRDHYRPGEDEIFCDDFDNFQELKNFMEIISPDNVDCVHYYEGTGVMVPDALEQQIDAIYQREIKTTSGARVVFDVTEAMIAIDVNSAQMRGASDIETTALRANKEAAEVIAKHLHLRDMSGLVVVDFIDMAIEANRRQLEEYFVSLLRKDRARVQWAGLSRFGMMELSRQRLSRPVEESQSVVCQTCRGTGRQRRPESFALRLLRKIRGMLPDPEAEALVVHAPSDSAVYLLNEKRVELRRMEDEYDCEILIAPLSDMKPHDYSIRKIKNEGKVGASYQARGGGEDKMRAEEMKQRAEKKMTGKKKPLIQTIIPEERAPDSDGMWGKLWKKIAGAFSSSAPSKTGDKKQGDKRRNLKKKRRQKSGNDESAAKSPPGAAENASAGRKSRNNGQRRRGQRMRQESPKPMPQSARTNSETPDEQKQSPTPAVADGDTAAAVAATPEIAAETNAEKSFSPPAFAENESLQKIETIGGDKTPVARVEQNEVQQLESGNIVREKRPPETAALMQVETAAPGKENPPS